ncbi:MAG: hypothetical protein N2513_06875 [Deltaproteobacteria bacterium]|nr:hypothetical protein [Deltaproteobacteria bacterium]
MRHKLVVVTSLCLMLLGFTFSHAALLGIKGSLGYPDIMFGDGTVTYSYYDSKNEGYFTLEATDLILTLSSGDEYYLSGKDFTTKLFVAVYLSIDPQGEPGFQKGYMSEWVDKGSINVGQNTYKVNDLLLFGYITKFGWGTGPDLGSFDMLIELDPKESLFVKDQIWRYDVLTGMYFKATKLSGWDGSWTKDFKLYEAEGDKAPVPIPPSILLFGSGFGLFCFRKLVNLTGRRS